MVGFAEVEYRYQEYMLFRFAGLCEYRRHELGEEQLDALAAAVAAEVVPPSPPDYLMADEAAADRRSPSTSPSIPDAYRRGRRTRTGRAPGGKRLCCGQQQVEDH